MRLSYTEWAAPDAPLLILIHGNRDHARSWDMIASALAGHYHIVAPDLRGHGDSAWSSDGRYNYAAYLADLAALCDTLGVGAVRPATLIGHSLGAHIALRYAGVVPDAVREVVGIEAVGPPPEIQHRADMPIDESLRSWFDERRKAAGAAPRHFASLAAAAQRMRDKHSYLAPAQARHLTRHGVRRDKLGWRWKYDPYLAVWPFPDMDMAQAELLWRRVACPTLLIFGEKSWPSSFPERIAAAIPGAREVRLAQSGHWPQHDALDDCLTAIRDFLGV